MWDGDCVEWMWLPGSHSLEENATELLHSYYSQTNITACQSLTTHSLTTNWQLWWCHTSWVRERERERDTHTDKDTFYVHCDKTSEQAGTQQTLREPQSKGNHHLHLKWGGSPLAKLDSSVLLMELSINQQRCTVIRYDLGLSQRGILRSERLLIRPGGHGVYDGITQPLSLHTHPSAFLCMSVQICPPTPSERAQKVLT